MIHRLDTSRIGCRSTLVASPPPNSSPAHSRASHEDEPERHKSISLPHRRRRKCPSGPGKRDATSGLSLNRAYMHATSHLTSSKTAKKDLAGREEAGSLRKKRLLRTRPSRTKLAAPCCRQFFAIPRKAKRVRGALMRERVAWRCLGWRGRRALWRCL